MLSVLILNKDIFYFLVIFSLDERIWQETFFILLIKIWYQGCTLTMQNEPGFAEFSKIEISNRDKQYSPDMLIYL